ncbi:MAG: FHA domain-containing serine/threonine-protein kinase [Thermoanaerobaculia bacterium]|jgi:serine/threonine-protein kinase
MSENFIGTVVGNYRVERELGEGGMSTVFVGRTVNRSELLPEDFSVVLKVMSEELANEATAKKRFLKEAQILSKLRHRYITRFFEFIARDTGAVLVMEFVEGTAVDKLLADKKMLPIETAVTITQCLLEALVYAHNRNIVHRDIKPANLIYQPNGFVKVTDFGIAKMREGSGGGQGQTVLTKSGFLLGTPHYMSPEQIREPKDAGAKSDVYSSAVVLYEMLTGTLPFNSRSLPKLIDAIYRGEKPLPSSVRPEVDKELEGIVLKAMEPDHNKRYASAREFFEVLEEWAAVRPLGARLAPAPATVKAPATSAQRWQIVHTNGSEMHEIPGDDTTVGRDRSCGIVLAHPAVSRRHARFLLAGGQVALEDLKSANGTFVNNNRIDRANVGDGDVIRFGADPTCSYVVKSLST